MDVRALPGTGSAPTAPSLEVPVTEPLRSEDDDDRSGWMTKDPAAYFEGARRQAEDAVRAQPPTGRSRQPRPVPAPGVVQVRLRGQDDADLQQLIERLDAAGIRAWHTPKRAYRDEDGAIVRYLSVDLRDTAT